MNPYAELEVPALREAAKELVQPKSPAVGLRMRRQRVLPQAQAGDYARYGFRDIVDALRWAAGFLEGEGCFTSDRGNAAHVQAVQVQAEPLERLSLFFGGPMRLAEPPKGNRQGLHQWAVAGVLAAGLMMAIYKIMSPLRKQQIAMALALWRTVGTHPKYRMMCRRGHPFDEKRVGRRQRRICRRCVNAYQRERAHRDPAARRLREAQYRQRNRAKVNQRNLAYYHRTKKKRNEAPA